MMTSAMKNCRIEAHERGGGLRSIQPMLAPAAELREVLQDMAALVRIARGKGSAADVERLGVESDADIDPVDVVRSWAVDIEANGGRVTILLTTGGPHVELDILRSESRGVVEEVILRRSWSPAHDRAWTNDGRALDVVEDFLDLIGC